MKNAVDNAITKMLKIEKRQLLNVKQIFWLKPNLIKGYSHKVSLFTRQKMSQHLKHKKFAITAAIIGAVVAGVSGAYFVPAQSILTMIPTTPEEQAKYDALGVAQRYIVTSPTFAFDGLPDTLDVEDVSVMESYPVQYRIRIAFDSANAGFGDRTGQILAQVITHHKMDIIVSEGNVISAITDDTWDELNHQYVLKPKLPSHDEPITEGINFQIDTQAENADRQQLQQVVKLAEERCPAVYSMSHVIKVNAQIQ